METKQQIILYIVFSIAIGWLIFALIPLLGLTYGTKGSLFILSAMMFAPVMANILTRLITKEGFREFYLKPNFKGNIRWYLFSFFIPTLLILVSGVLYFLIRPASFDSNFTLLKMQLATQEKIGSVQALLFLSIIQVVVIGPVINIIPTLGEELGWRGYLLPKLRLITSDRKALLLSGAIWGFWHLPAIVAGHNYGTLYPLYPALGIVAMIIFCITMGIIEGYVTIKTNSAIGAAMIHSTLNAGAALPILLSTGTESPLLGPAVTGLLGGAPFMVVALVLFIHIGSEKKREISTT